jgi:hypothetical protein
MSPHAKIMVVMDGVVMLCCGGEAIGATHLEMWWPRRRHGEIEGAALGRDETRRR